MKVFVFAENYDALSELCCFARRLSDQVEAIVIGSLSGVNGVNKVWFIPAQDGAMLEDYTETLSALVDKEKPKFMLFEPTKRCKLIAGRLAAMIGVSVMTDVLELTREGEAKRMVYGGLAICWEKATTSTIIVMVKPGVLEGSPEAAIGIGKVENFDFVEPKIKVKVIDRIQKSKTPNALPCAKHVVGVGLGIAKTEGLAMARRLAEVIDGEVGCTRPVVEIKKLMAKETYIGISGLSLVPEVYLALGISGQVQHMIGINRAKVIIAINKDKNAPIFEQADYGIVGDVYKIVPYMINQLK